MKVGWTLSLHDVQAVPGGEEAAQRNPIQKVNRFSIPYSSGQNRSFSVLSRAWQMATHSRMVGL